jgi:hypothetical protein
LAVLFALLLFQFDGDSGTSRGIPCFAEAAMDEFFKSLD